MSLPPFQILVDAHAHDLHRFLVASVGPEEAEDCLQETLLAALRAYPSLRDGSNLRGWLFTIAHRKGIDLHRARARRPIPVSVGHEGSARDAAAEDDGLWTSVRRLPRKQQSAVLYRFVADLSYAEIAPLLECSVEAARRNVHEGLERLRKEGWE